MDKKSILFCKKSIGKGERIINMDILVIVMLLALDMLLFEIYKKIYNPSILFTSFWIVILTAGHFRLLGEDVTSTYTYIIIFIGILSFAVGGFWVGRINKVNFKFGIYSTCCEKGKQYECQLRKGIIIAIFGFAILYSTYNLLKLAPLLRSGYSIGDIRQLYLTTGASDIINGSAFSYFIQNTVFLTCQTSCVIIGCTEYLVNKKWKLLIGAMYTVGVSGLTYGSRIIFVDIILYIVFGMIILSDKKRRKKKETIVRKLSKMQKVTIVFGIISAVAILVYITTMRQGKNSLWRALYSDYTCCIRLLDISVKQAIERGDITWGVLGIMGVIEPFVAILGSSLFGRLVPLPEAFTVLAKYTNEFVNIGSGQMNNAYVSIFFYFFLDGRIPGLIIGMLICGCFATLVYNRIATKEYDSIDFGFFLLIICIIFRSMIRFQLAVPSCFWSFVVVYLAYRKKVIR